MKRILMAIALAVTTGRVYAYDFSAEATLADLQTFKASDIEAGTPGSAALVNVPKAVAVTGKTPETKVSAEESLISCFWDEYFKQTRLLIETISKLEGQEAATTDLGLRAGYRLDKLNAAYELDLMGEQAKTLNYLNNERGESFAQAMKHTFASIHDQCSGLTKGRNAADSSDLRTFKAADVKAATVATDVSKTANQCSYSESEYFQKRKELDQEIEDMAVAAGRELGLDRRNILGERLLRLKEERISLVQENMSCHIVPNRLIGPGLFEIRK